MFKSYPFLPNFGEVCFEVVPSLDLQCVASVNNKNSLPCGPSKTETFRPKK